MIVRHCLSTIQSISPQGGGLFSYTPHFCVVPEALYQEENQDLWLNFLEEHIDRNQVINADDIKEEKCVVLHEKESSGHEEHCVALLMRKSQSITELDKVCAMVVEKMLCIVLYKNGRLQLANVFSIESIEDILYYLLNVGEQFSKNIRFPIYIANGELLTDKTLSTYLELHHLPLE